MNRKIILIKQELLLLVYELNRSVLLAENEKIRPILAQLEKLLLCDLSPSTNDSVKNCFFFSSRRRHTRSVSSFLLNRSSDLSASVRTSVFPARTRKVNANNSAALTGRSTPLIMFSVNSAPSMMRQAV